MAADLRNIESVDTALRAAGLDLALVYLIFNTAFSPSSSPAPQLSPLSTSIPLSISPPLCLSPAERARVPTVVLCECVLVYLAPAHVQRILQWAASFPDAAMLDYEPVRPQPRYQPKCLPCFRPSPSACPAPAPACSGPCSNACLLRAQKFTHVQMHAYTKSLVHVRS